MRKYFIIALACILLDQIIKFIITRNFAYTKNYGAAFGILQNKASLIIILTFFALGFLVYYSTKVKSYGSYGLGLVFGGLIGNLIDRLIYGYVVDYIKIGGWPAFNLADVFLVAGVTALIFYMKNARNL